MTRTAWAAIILLLATNAAWCVAWLGGDGGQDGSLDADDPARTIAAPRADADTPKSRTGSPGGATGMEPTLPGESESGPGLELTGERPDPETEQRAAELRDAEEAATRHEAQTAALANVKAMLRKALQVKDPALREQGLREIAGAIEGGDPFTVEYALGALWSIRGLEFDRTEFRRLVEAHLRSEHAGIRRSALYGLYATSPQEGDLKLALASAKDPDPVVRRHTGRILKLYTNGKIEGPVSDAFVALLCEEDASVRKATLRGLWGTQVTPSIEQKLIEIAKRPEERGDAIYFGLSTLESKSRPVVDTLFTYLVDDEPKIRQRAHWGLQRGIREQDQPYVARRYAAHLEEFVNPQTHREVLKLVARYGDESAVQDLERFAGNEMVREDVRSMARKAIAYLRTKADRPH